ncbi:MAG: putative rRNA maturation factor [Parcubacteria group bacterium GW2011_GWD2_43_10]|nr:MAG: putative rRNA maturation factor [Parcubacteria group bacterium GW2011_GWA2_42_80]KKS83237.1 MAG: putative rRNA maturation factor [Parcubacteria group bacterium GW2011_GWD2_43_10]KKS92130.1 MAG: putative rRNA maturation factor [Parcubacteria group bacterium GW2011_GWE2_43_12]KKT13096.1 MAG: putative rRNA maturation factor [Parcubacteria group bacterium GW2011_GWA1_43_27]KKT14535.1 MAG: putative rRNA maturation factor [Parcubacteria group bacterium GW2011_GWF2_43_38]KKT16670.1 MAG: putat
MLIRLRLILILIPPAPPSRFKNMAVDFSLQNISGGRVPASFKLNARRILKRIAKVTRKKFSTVSLVLVKTQTIRQLNAVYRHRPKVTDVLSFTYKQSQPMAGEIFICLAQAKRQAKAFGTNFNNELEFLFVHGCLHLLGYDHIKSRDRTVMETMEYRVLGRGRLAK